MQVAAVDAPMSFRDSRRTTNGLVMDPAGGDLGESVDDSTGVLVRTHPGLCLGWGNCHRFAPYIYPLDAEGKVDIERLAVSAEHAHDAWLGAAACPEGAITVRRSRS